MRLLVVAAFSLLALTGCKSPCRRLSEKLCDCSVNSLAKTDCLQRVGNAEAANPPTAADDATCTALYEGCDCRLIDTPEGKVRCGLARPAVLSAAADAGS
ncbi:MAG: hypothetical protein K1X89_02010 [Myxococcaceae bacterium]|nr:hypothetical protein [Myxococcaceae bacterium]